MWLVKEKSIYKINTVIWLTFNIERGNGWELYAEQGDAYAFFKHQGYTSMSSTTWYKPENDPFFLTDFYSFAFLRRLRRALVIAGTKEISQDDFHNSSMLFTYKWMMHSTTFKLLWIESEIAYLITNGVWYVCIFFCLSKIQYWRFGIILADYECLL